MTSNRHKRIITVILSVFVFLVFNASNTEAALKGVDQQKPLVKKYVKLPLSFIQNDGQMDEKVKFYERGNGHTTFFTKEGMTLVLTGTVRKNAVRQKAQSQGEKSEKFSEVVRLIPLGANKNPEIVAESKQKGVVNTFIGNDRTKWKTGISTYQSVLYKALYPNIDLRFYGNNRQFEYDVIVKPGADPSTVRLAYEGVQGLKITKNGALEIALKTGTLVQNKPYIYQEINGKRVEVDGKFVLLDQKGKHPFPFGFEVAKYDKTRTLTIDPVLVYSTFLGGDGDDIVGRSDGFGFGFGGGGIAVDSDGNLYIAGSTGSSNFPGTSAQSIQQHRTSPFESDVFVTKITPDGSAIAYSTYLGGDGTDWAADIVVDAAGNAYLTGGTISLFSDLFPTTVSAISSCNSLFTSLDTFVTKISPTGALEYSTCLGFTGIESGSGIAIDGTSHAYIAGTKTSNLFDAFVAKISSDGSSIIYTKDFGGNLSPPGFPEIKVFSVDSGQDIAVDTNGNVYLLGTTSSNIDFPGIEDLAVPTIQDIQKSTSKSNVFVAKIDAAGTVLLYSTYLGGGQEDVGHGIAVDDLGNAYVTGITGSADFPLSTPTLQGTVEIGTVNAFVTKINSSGTAFAYSTFFGGNFGAFSYDIAVDTTGNAFITGETISTVFPIIPVDPLQGSLDPSTRDAFVAEITPDGSVLQSLFFLGGTDRDSGRGIALDSTGNVYIAGETFSADFPTLDPLQGTFEGNISNIGDIGSDVFIAKLSTATTFPDISVTPQTHDFGSVTLNTSSNKTFTITNDGNAPLNINTIVLSTGAQFGIVPGQDNCSGQPPLASTTSCTFEVGFNPTSAGTFTDNLNISSTDPDENPMTVNISGTAIAALVPDINIAPLNHDFGSVTLGASANKTFTITNNGAAPLAINTIALATAAQFNIVPGLDNCSGQPPFAPTTSCTFEVGFNPTSMGSFNDSLNITSNDPDVSENPMTVSMSGTGVAATSGNQSPTAPELVFPADGATVDGPDVAFGFNRSTDPDGDIITYTLTACEDAALTVGCITESNIAAIKNREIDFARLSLGFGLVFGLVFVSKSKGRRKAGMLMALILVSGMLLASCGDGGDDVKKDDGAGNPTADITKTLTGLKAGTTYHWKVTADDGKGGTANSEQRNFSTQ